MGEEGRGHEKPVHVNVPTYQSGGPFKNLTFVTETWHLLSTRLPARTGKVRSPHGFFQLEDADLRCSNEN